jgi:putative ABC transport system permease protein
MSALHRKLLRDLWHYRGLAAAVALVVACGVASYVATRSAYRSLLASQDGYYRRYRFADVFASVQRAPESLVRRVQAIPGVAAAESRIVVDVALDVPGLPEPATGRVLSLPEGGGPPVLNRVALTRGRFPEGGRRDEVVVSQAFAGANRLEIGERLGGIFNGRWQSLRIVGIGLSPEYVYEIAGAGAILPDNRRFGVLWMPREALGPAFDMDGAFNDIALQLAPRARRGDVLAELDRLLEPYGGLGAYGREDQVSHNFLDNELGELRAEGRIVPVIFLGVAIFLLHIVVTRLVHTQRDQIAVLKALGYGNGAVGIHFLEFVLVIVAVGALVGTAAGLSLGSGITRMYADFFRFPVLRFETSAGILAAAVLGTLAAASLGALGAVGRAVSLPPAEAMRPAAPDRFRARFLDRWRWTRRLSPSSRMLARQVARRPYRFAFSVLGISLAVAILVLGRFFLDVVDEVMDLHFRVVSRENATVAFTEPRGARARHELSHLPGVWRCEPFRAVPVRLHVERRSKRIALLGLEPGAELRRVVDRRRRRVDLPPEGLVLTSHLAETLRVRPGDSLELEVLEGRRPVRVVRVSGLVDELVGVSAYMDLAAVHRLLGEQGSISGAYLAMDPGRTDRLYGVLKRTPAISAVSLRAALVASFRDTIARTMGMFTAVLIALASVIAVAMVYNGARIALSERGRELASLRVLGFTRAEVSAMLLGEQALTTALAVPAGWGIGLSACALISRIYDTDLMRLPLVVSSRTYAFALLTIAVAAVLSGLVVRRRIDRMDLVAVLKTRE